MANFIRLPTDIYDNILSFFPHDKEILNFGLINKQWAEQVLNEERWKKVLAQKYPIAISIVTKNFKKCYFMLEAQLKKITNINTTKLAVMGLCGVGKTNLTVRYTRNIYYGDNDPTM